MGKNYSVEDLCKGTDFHEKLSTLKFCLSANKSDGQDFRKKMEGVRELVMSIDCIMYRMYRMGDRDLYHQMQTNRSVDDVYLTWLGVGAVSVVASTLSMLSTEEQMLRPIAADFRQRADRSHGMYLKMFSTAH